MVKRTKIFLAVLYILYFLCVIVNVTLAQIGITNGLIERYGAAGYFVTFFLSLVFTGGWFALTTAVQAAVYHVYGLRVIPLALIEALKLSVDAVRIYFMDVYNIIGQRGFTTVSFFLGLSTALFVIIAAADIAAVAILKLKNPADASRSAPSPQDRTRRH